MAYKEGTDGPCSPLMEIHSLSWLLHRREHHSPMPTQVIPSPPCELSICQVPEFSKDTAI